MKNINKAINKKLFLSSPLVGYPACSINSTNAIENLTNSDIQTETLMQYYEKYNPDILFPFMDLVVEAESLGVKIKMNENEPPEVIEHPINSEANLSNLTLPNISSNGRFNVYLETINNLKKNSQAIVCGYVTSPFTMAGLLTGAGEISMQVLVNPDFIHKLLKFSLEVSLNYALKQEESGADCIVLLEPTASLLSPDLFKKFVTPYINKIVDSLNIPIILHVCGDTTNLIEAFTETKMNGLSLDSAIDLNRVIRKIPKDFLVMGNIDPINTMLKGDPKKIYKETINLLDKLKDYRNFIPATGCDVPPQTDIKNIEAFMVAIDEGNEKYKNCL